MAALQSLSVEEIDKLSHGWLPSVRFEEH